MPFLQILIQKQVIETKRKYTLTVKRRAPMINLKKVHDIDPIAYATYKFDHSPVVYKEDGTLEERIKTGPVYCVFFGCGKRLSLNEKLCGERCIDHPKGMRNIW